MFNCCARVSSASLIRFGNRLGIPSHKYVFPLSVPRETLSSSSGSDVLSPKNDLKTQKDVEEFIGKLSEIQKQSLLNTLQLEALRKKYHDELGHYLSKFGRPSTHPAGVEDATGTLCEVSPEWLQARKAPADLLIQDVPKLKDELKCTPATSSDIWAVALKNCLPFIGFGFLDNLIMILAGDYIELKIGMAIGISTMAAAALGNTISDVAGIASAWYVEMFAEKAGIKEPKLTAFQLASWQIRWATNSGRALGVVIGCLLGMFPLLFLPSAGEKKEKEKQKKAE